MKVAITGASGHVGNCLCKKLNTLGIRPRVLLHKDENDFQHMDVEIIEGDVLDIESLKRFCKGADIIYHLAARISIDNKSKDQVYKINVEGTRNLLQVCTRQKIAKLIHFGTIHSLEPEPLDRELDENRSFIQHISMIYEQSKCEGEKLVLEKAKQGFPAVILNPTAIIGPYDFRPSYLGQALIRMYNNSLPMLIPGGYDWVDVRDVVDGAISAAEKAPTGERYILSGKWISLKDLSIKIGELTGRKTPKTIVPTGIARIGVPFIRFYASLAGQHPLYTNEVLDILRQAHPNISSRKAASQLGYKSRPIEETLTDTFNWYREHNMIK